MSSPLLLQLLMPLLLALAFLCAFLVYVAIRYTPIVGRIFEEKPLFLPLRVPPLENDGEEARFLTADGVEIAGTYLGARTRTRAGVVVFCHEYLSNRWSCVPYTDSLRDLGFDVFTFDFRNHGDSGRDAVYQPLQWVTDHETKDLHAALTYLRTRPDHDDAGFALFGVSRGGGTALVAAAKQRDVWGVITDGAFPTKGTMLAYILRWAEIYVGSEFLWKRMPLFIFAFIGWMGRVASQRRLHCRFPDIERAVARIAPRPWLMIHGEKDAYIGTPIAKRLFAEARAPKELWIVPKAKHNRCREVEPKVYAARLAEFLRQSAPRRLPATSEPLPTTPARASDLSSSGVFGGPAGALA